MLSVLNKIQFCIKVRGHYFFANFFSHSSACNLHTNCIANFHLASAGGKKTPDHLLFEIMQKLSSTFYSATHLRRES
jgi:hypothetical protein